MEPPLPFVLSYDAEQQGLDWVLAHTALRRRVFRADHLRWPKVCRRTPGIRGAGAQLRIPTSQLLDLDPCILSSTRSRCHHTRSVSLRDALWTGFSQSSAMARRSRARLPEFAGDKRPSPKHAMDLSLRDPERIGDYSGHRRTRCDPPPALFEDRLLWQL